MGIGARFGALIHPNVNLPHHRRRVPKRPIPRLVDSGNTICPTNRGISSMPTLTRSIAPFRVQFPRQHSQDYPVCLNVRMLE
jgi:hypothetical protein